MKRSTLACYPFARLRIVCFKCRRAGSYRVARLAERFGADIPLWNLMEQIAGNCPHWFERSLGKRVCGAHLPDLYDALGHPAPEECLPPWKLKPSIPPGQIWPVRVEIISTGPTEVVARTNNVEIGVGAWERAVKLFPHRTVTLFQEGHRHRLYVPEDK